MNIEINNLSYALLGGVLPALVWLWFWLKEDNRHPEPKRLIAICFGAGMIAVWPILGAESIAHDITSNATVRLILWSAIEEIGKLATAFIIVFWRKELDEPIDYVIYMITIALGFAALENTLFLLKTVAEGQVMETVITGNMRFVGATLVHVSASAIIGITMAFGFFKEKAEKTVYLGIGVILAIALHTAFNLSIIMSDGRYGFLVSGTVWTIIVILLLILEKVKKIHPV